MKTQYEISYRKLKIFSNIKRRYREYLLLASDRKLMQSNPNALLNAFIAQKAVFVHIPKTAGISLVKSIYGENIERGGHRKITHISKLMPGPLNDYFTFTIIRNPWDRLYSAYKFMMNGGINQHDENAFNLHLSSINSFEDFVMNWLHENNLKHIIHFYPQSWFLKDNSEKVELDFIGRFEYLSSDFAKIANKIGVENKLKHLNKGDKRSYKTVYNQEMKEKVKLIYKEDIERFKYTF